jgi:hypothetical protein
MLIGFVAMIVIASLLAIFCVIKALPYILQRFISQNSNEEDDEEIPLIINFQNRTNKEHDEESLKYEIDQCYEDFLNEKPISMIYNLYPSHREMDIGPAIQTGID